jgi:predicted  nucleic acid-binding Zn-ribbon protein
MNYNKQCGWLKMSEARKRVRIGGSDIDVGLGVGGPELMMDSAFAKALQSYKIEEDKSLRRLQALQIEYSALQAQYDSIEERMHSASEAQHQEIQDLDKVLTALKEQTKNQEGVIQTLEAQQKSIQQTSAANVAAVNAELSSLQAQYEELQKQHASLTSENATLIAEVTLLGSNKTDLAAQVTTLQETFDAQKTALTTQVGGLTTQAASLEGKITALETIKNGFTQQISSTVSILSQWPGTDTSTVPGLIEAVLINENNADTWRNAVETEPIASILAETQNELETLKNLRELATENADYQTNLNTYATRLTAFAAAVRKAAESFSAEVKQQWSTGVFPQTRKEAIQAYLTVPKMKSVLREAVNDLIDIKSITPSAAAAGRGTTAQTAPPTPPKAESASASVSLGVESKTAEKNVSTTNASDAMADDLEIAKRDAEAQKRKTTTAELVSGSDNKSSRQRVGSENTQAFVTHKPPAKPSSVTPSPSGATPKPQLPPSPTTTPAAAAFTLKPTAAPPSLPSTGGGGAAAAADTSKPILAAKPPSGGGGVGVGQASADLPPLVLGNPFTDTPPTEQERVDTKTDRQRAAGTIRSMAWKPSTFDPSKYSLRELQALATATKDQFVGSATKK